MRGANFGDDEIIQEGHRLREEMLTNNFSGKEVDDYFGIKRPNMAPVKSFFEENLKKWQAENEGAFKDQTPAQPNFGSPTSPIAVDAPVNPSSTPETHAADSFVEAFQSGTQISVSGLIARGKAPDTLLPEDAPWYYGIAQAAGMFVGDVPPMALGAIAGGVAGSTLGPGGTALGGWTGGAALPEALRKGLMDSYQKGEIQDFQDYWERVGAIALSSIKGGATGFAGGKAGQVVGGLALPVAKGLAVTASELATLTTVGKALDGELPKFQDFVNGAFIVGGLHGALKVSPKLQNTWVKTNLKPYEVINEMKESPSIKQDLSSINIDVPTAFDKFVTNPEVKPSVEEATTDKAESAPVRSEAEQKLAAKIGMRGEPVKDGLTFRKLYTGVVDSLDPIGNSLKQLGIDKSELPGDVDPKLLARLAKDAPAKADTFLRKATLNFKDLSENGKSFDSIIEPFKGDPQGLDYYLAANRVVTDLEPKGLKSPIDYETARQVVKEGKDKYGAAAQEIYDFKDRVLEYAKESGILSEKNFDLIKEANKAHVSFSHIFETEEGGKTPGKTIQSLKRYKGTEEGQIQSPILTTIENTQALIVAAEKNRARSAMIDQALKVEGQTLFEKVPQQSVITEVSAKEAQSALSKQGIEAKVDAFECL
jgi:hypothetical protein